ncbi:MAG: hypothetical protein FH762_01435 [Firmicutes bacterium]|nr:hypothetical protein [Bacillota bacterium]
MKYCLNKEGGKNYMDLIKKKIVWIVIIAVLFSLLSVNTIAAENKYVVSFDPNGRSSSIEDITVAKGEIVELPDNPVRSGYIFAGWYIAPNGSQYQAFNPDTPISADITLYAQWLPEDHVRYIETTDGSTIVKLGYSIYSGVEIRKMSDNTIVPESDLTDGTIDYPVYKDLNKNGILDVYEDWRKDIESRTIDLAAQMSYEEIAGLMLYSSHQRSWDKSIPTQDQVAFLSNDDLRHVLIAGEIPAEIAAPWNNSIQAISEKLGLGIPANNSSDPRHSAAVGVEYYSSNTGTISLWPNSLGLAATFDPELVYDFAKIASIEYRALGISTALSPQIDIATEPRWNRTNGTFGEDPRLAADMTAAYVSGFQGTFDTNGNDSWGYDSVNAMIKHWPGGGAGEGGRDAHSDYGKYSVFPGENFDAHTIPFVDGGLIGENSNTTMATAVMPYYTISYNVDPSGEDLANAYSEYIITDLLRDKYNFDGVICTDWGVDGQRGWGPDIETLDTAQRSKLLIEAGVNQFGGRNTSKYILEAVKLAREEGSEAQFRDQLEYAAVRLLKNIFRTNLFENPYLDEHNSMDTVANQEFVEKGYEVQLKSIVMLKNHEDLLPLPEKSKVYIPKKDRGYIFKGAKNGFTVVDNPENADLAIVTLNSPQSPSGGHFGGGWSADEGYNPLTLQYSEYTAVKGRDVSVAGDYRNIIELDGEASSKYLNRSFKNKKVKASNFNEYQVLLDTKKAMGNKPVIAVINLDNPMVFKEIDPLADSILLRFAASDNAVLDIISGREEPSALLPLQMPANMAAVEEQYEDLPRDMEVYVDSDGNAYDFAFGLNWSGVIKDQRVTEYKVEPLTAPQSVADSNTTANYVTVETDTLPIAKIGEAYHARIKTRGENSTLLLVEGELPAGLSFNNGVINGIPTDSTEKYGERLKIEASAPGKEKRIVGITLVVNKTGAIELADPNELSILINLASARNQADYPADKWAEFTAALDNAKQVYTLVETLSQETIDNAVRLLEKALK